MLRPLLGFVLIGSALIATAPAVRAQDSTYGKNALRLEKGAGVLRILQGPSDSVLMTIGAVHRTDVARIVAPSSTAMEQARLFDSNYRPGVWTVLTGVAVLGYGYGISRIGANDPIPTGVFVTSLALVTYGATRIAAATSALSKAIWLYNQDIKR
jgi:hypothetical protein